MYVYIHIYIHVIYITWVCKEVHYKKLARVIMAAEKSRPRRADGLIPVQV